MKALCIEQSEHSERAGMLDRHRGDYFRWDVRMGNRKLRLDELDRDPGDADYE